MSTGAKCSLVDLLVLDVDEVPVVATDEYPIAGVYGFGRGVFGRGPIAGSGTSYKKLHRLHSGQLVVSRLKAFEGALAVVPNKLDGWFLSPEFPTFRCIDGELDPGYLAHICRWPEFWSMLATTSKGIGARRERVHAEDLLRIKLRVPPIDEQRQLAHQLDGLHEATSAITQRSQRAATLTEAFVASATARPDLDDGAKARAGWRRVPLGSVMSPVDHGVLVEPTGRYRIAGIYSFGRGLIDRDEITGAETSYKMFTVLREGDVVVSKLNGWEGAVAVVDRRFHGYCVSSEYPTFTVNDNQLLPAFFGSIARSPWFWETLNSNARGSMVRRRRINSTEFLGAQIWLPPLKTQRQLVGCMDVVDRAATMRDSNRVLTEALVPAALNNAFAGFS